MSETKFKTRSTRNADWDRHPEIKGKVTEKGEHEDDGRKAPFIVVDTGVSLVRVYSSTDLEELFKVVSLGDSVRIEFVERVQLKGGRQFIRFDSSCWTGEDPEAV